jgi:hypothetical protein
MLAMLIKGVSMPPNSRVSKDEDRGPREKLPRNSIFELMHDGSDKGRIATPKGVQSNMDNGSKGKMFSGDDRRTIGQLKKSG